MSFAALSQITSQSLTLVPMIGFGIPGPHGRRAFLIVASMVPREKTGVYIGIFDMMIVVPMLVETVTFGWIFENLLGSKSTNAMLVPERCSATRPLPSCRWNPRTPIRTLLSCHSARTAASQPMTG